MKLNKKVSNSFLILIIIAVGYRLIPMPVGIYGFTPMFAMAIFGGATFRNNKKYAFALPILAFFLSDVFFELLYRAGEWKMPGFYEGQFINYLLFALITCIGFFIHKVKVVNVFIASLVAPSLYFILSNFAVWAGSNLYPKTTSGLFACYSAGVPFYFPYSLISTLVFSSILFGSYYIIQNNNSLKPKRNRVHV